MSEEVKAEIDRCVNYISSLTGILQIYLFGSYANGKSHKTSDVDLMIVIENHLDPFKIAYKIRRGFAEADFTPDIVVNRLSAFEEASINSSFQKTIKESGILLYAA